MPTYDFSTLNDKDLEKLTRDLLSAELSIPFQSFKVGKDKGIDLRYSTNTNENKIVVQVKHYIKSGYNQLIYVLKNQEKPKIELLNPERYIFVTSIPLSVTDKETIKNILSPYILNTNDIYGCDEINSLLVRHENIEKKYIELWCSNVNVLQTILNNGIHGRSLFQENRIRKNLKLYVQNRTFNSAIDILREQKILLITGIPGIGKSTLANMVTYYLLSKDFRLVYIDEKIREAEDVFDNNPEVKQVFYFDDFLGSNYLDIINLRNTDKSMVGFIERVKASKNKYLILTTRSTILNQAKGKNEKLNRANLDTLKYELEITNYSKYDKARILYNHIYFNDLNIDYIEEIFKNKNYWEIITHKNYNPRLIQFFTRDNNINHLKKEDYIGFVISHLNNPSEIWDSALTNQLNHEERLLLFTLLSFGRSIDKKHLEEAFEDRITYEVRNHGLSRNINIFNISLKNLLDGYITNTFNNLNSINSLIHFVNPSLKDYLIAFFNKNTIEKWHLIESFTYVEQFIEVFRKHNSAINYINISKEETRKFIELAETKSLKSTSRNGIDNISIRLIYLFNEFRDDNTKIYIDEFILARLKSINWIELSPSIFIVYDLYPVMLAVDKDDGLYQFFYKNWDIIIPKILTAVTSKNELEIIRKLYAKYEQTINRDYLPGQEFDELLLDAINKAYENEVKDLIEVEQNLIFSHEDFEDLQDKANRLFDEYISPYFINTNDIYPQSEPLYDLDVDDLIAQNSLAEEEALKHEDDSKYFDEDTENEEIKIDNLFSYYSK